MFFWKEKRKRLTPEEVKNIVEEHYDDNGGVTKELALKIVDKVFSGKFKNNNDKTISVSIQSGKPLYDRLIDRDLLNKTLKEHSLAIVDYNSNFWFGCSYQLKLLDRPETKGDYSWLDK